MAPLSARTRGLATPLSLASAPALRQWKSATCIVRSRATLGGGGSTLPRIAILPSSTPAAARSAASAAAASTAAVSKAKPTFRKFTWKVVARAAYYFRIPFLVLSVYGVGYQQGIMDYSREPEYKESKLMESMLAGVGCAGELRDEVLVASEGEWRGLMKKLRSLMHAYDKEVYEELHRRVVMVQDVAGVGEKVIKVAQSYVKGKLMDAVREATAQMPPEIVKDRNKLHEALLENDEVELWTKASKHMEGPWRFVLIPSPIDNAFVSEVLPRRIFITTSFIESFIESQDELALVLGHELSHLILGHSSERNQLEMTFRTIEILLLSLDPTEGLMSLAFMAFLASVRTAIGAVHSRENERLADELGIKLCAMACYDTRAASQVFRKMHLKNVESGAAASTGPLSFFDSHPPSDERFRALLEESERENREKYEGTSCRGITTMFRGAMKQRKEEGR